MAMLPMDSMRVPPSPVHDHASTITGNAASASRTLPSPPGSTESRRVRETLARRSCRSPASGPALDLPASGAVQVAGVHDVKLSAPARPDTRAPRTSGPLRALASRAREACTLALSSTVSTLRVRKSVLPAVQLSIAVFLHLVASSSLQGALPPDQAHRAVWEIHNLKPGESFNSRRHSFGTTFAIESGTHTTDLFVTNAHVLYGLQEVGASLQDLVLSRKGSATRLKVDRIVSLSGVYDLALIQTTTRVNDYLDLAGSVFVQPGLQHAIPGYPLGIRRTLHQTAEIGYRDLHSFAFAIDGTKLGGLSGGPILDRSGNVAGVFHSSQYNIIYGVKLVHLKRIIEDKIPCRQPRMLEACLAEDSDRVKQLAMDGNPVAQYQLTRHKNYVSIVDEDLDLKFRFLRESSKLPFAPFIYQMATQIYHGERGFRLNEKRAFALFLKCARQHYVDCQHFVALLYAHGTGTRQSWERAEHWIRRGADQGYAPSQYELGTMYLRGLGVDEDREVAMYWREKAARQGYAPARSYLETVKGIEE